MDLNAFQCVVSHAIVEPVWGQILANVKQATVEGIAQNFVRLVHGAQIVLNNAPARMVLHATQNLENAHVQLAGWVQFVMKSVPEEIMDKTAKIVADVKMAASVTMYLVHAHVRKDGRALYVTAPVRLESTDQIVRTRVCVRTMETAIL